MQQRAFTLIELSIVLVIIGLIVGGVLVGRDLINSATVRAQLTQIEKIQSSVHTFRGKYDGYLPGDIPGAMVAKFGFTVAPTRAGAEGRGDGNGELAGYSIGSNVAYSWNQNGENLFFWEDLTTNSGLLDGNFSTYADGATITCASMTTCRAYIPEAKMGNGNSIYVYSGYATGCCATGTGNGPNFIGITNIKSLNGGTGGSNVSTGTGGQPATAITVAQAFNMDKKVDDGFPASGNVLAQYLGGPGGGIVWSPYASASTSSTCYSFDIPITQGQYSITQNNGAGVNCAISFQLK